MSGFPASEPVTCQFHGAFSFIGLVPARAEARIAKGLQVQGLANDAGPHSDMPSLDSS